MRLKPVFFCRDYTRQNNVSNNGRGECRPENHDLALTLQENRRNLEVLSIHLRRALRPSNGIQPRVGIPLLVRPRQAPENVTSWERLKVKGGVGALFGDEGEFISIKDHLQVDMHVIKN
ncbi:hypothetical protein PanWU01x14_363930 [Parasponia andersonii]|uniref:Uncharacterized protein n=1 Tax=Parasponia andersonii TaxID=3476 RepID=A0A2P5A6H9_PARAD|nr:hypothetical protein PanWU01x14_363930 [Parasponia andersonii]